MTTEIETAIEVKHIKRFDPVQSGLATIREECKDLSNMDTVDGRKENAAKIKLCRDSWVKTEELRVEEKREALEYGRYVDSEAKRIVGDLHDIAAPHQEQKAQYEAKVAEAKAAEELRVSDIKIAIKLMTVVPELDADSTTIQTAIDKLIATHCDKETFAEFAVEALDTKNESLHKLYDMLEKRIKYDEDQADLAARQKKLDEAEAEANEAAAKKRLEDSIAEAKRNTVNKNLQDINGFPQQAMGKPMDSIQSAIDTLKDHNWFIGVEDDSDKQIIQEAINKAAYVLDEMLKERRILDKSQAEVERKQAEIQEREAALEQKEIEPCEAVSDILDILNEHARSDGTVLITDPLAVANKIWDMLNGEEL